MSLTNRIIVEGENTWGCKSGWLDVDNVKQALKDYRGNETIYSYIIFGDWLLRH